MLEKVSEFQAFKSQAVPLKENQRSVAKKFSKQSSPTETTLTKKITKAEEQKPARVLRSRAWKPAKLFHI